jgi:SnoaL-like domain
VGAGRGHSVRAFFTGRTPVAFDLESRVRQLEDRVLISECVIKYALGVDRADWKMFVECFTDPVYIDHSENGLPAADYARDHFVGIVRDALSSFVGTQHLSPNHVIEFDPNDSDRAICHSSMYAQHYREDADGGRVLVLHGSYTNYMARTSDGWRIARQIQHVGWSDEN